MKLAALAAIVVLSPAAALADPPRDDLAEPARTVVNDCQDNGRLDDAYTLAQLDKAEFQVIHYPALNHPDPGNPEYRRPEEECQPMIDEALQVALGPSSVPLTDCMANGSIEGAYTAGELRDARQDIPRQWAEVSDCPGVLANATPAAAKVTAARHRRPPAWVLRAILRAGEKATHHHGKVRGVRRSNGWYGQMRWATRRRGACYAEAVTRHRKAHVVGRYCKP